MKRLQRRQFLIAIMWRQAAPMVEVAGFQHDAWSVTLVAEGADPKDLRLSAVLRELGVAEVDFLLGGRSGQFNIEIDGEVRYSRGNTRGKVACT